VPISHARRLAAALPGVVVHETAGLGHRRILRDPVVLDLAADHLVGAGVAGRLAGVG
jgi:hypothetical protein